MSAPAKDSALPSRDSDVFCQLRQDRPSYVCPKCKKEAMQFYSKCEHVPGREDFFLCCACGSTWDM